MKSGEMRCNVVYEVTKGSSDGTFSVGDKIFISSDDNSIITDFGWLDEPEWNIKYVNDFEVRVSDEFYVEVTGTSSGIKKIPRDENGYPWARQLEFLSQCQNR
jgi:hypothetical protein